MSAKGFTLDKCRQGIITVLTGDNGLKTVDYRGTSVVKEVNYNTLALNTNGWLTVTSKKVMNRYFNLRNLPLRVFQKDFVWYVEFTGAEKRVMEYNDNMLLSLS